jgi:hypothetical protein
MDFVAGPWGDRSHAGHAARDKFQALESSRLCSAIGTNTDGVMTVATLPKKISPPSWPTQEIEVAAVTMMLRYCHTCGFLARFL